MPEQLSLRFPLRREFTFANFAVGAGAGDNNSSAEAVQRLSALARQTGFVGLWLWGPAGVGKTHLLHAACQLHGGRVGYLPLADMVDEPDCAASLASQEPVDLLALDDMDAWLGQGDQERAMQGVYQGQVHRAAKLLVTSSVPPGALVAELADLDSRLRSMSCYEVQPLTDASKHRLLQDRAKERGLIIADHVLDFWLARADRNLGVLLAQLQQVIAAALTQQRQVTVPLLKRVLQL